MRCQRATFFIVTILSVLHTTRSKPTQNDSAINLDHMGPMIYGRPSDEAGRQLIRWHLNKRPGNAEEQGNYFEGDILFPNSMLRNGLRSESHRWKDGIVPVEIEKTFSSEALGNIKLAMKQYHTYTCLKFVQKEADDRDYLFIQNRQTGCWSSVGRVGGRQELNLQSPGCTTKVGTVMHELMHAVGFLHEHTREDRDSHVDVLTQNIKPGYESDFQKATPGSTNMFGVQYDYGSVLHYSPNAFSRNGQPTISAKVSSGNSRMGQRENFSEGDLQKINAMYNCGNGAKKDQSLTWMDQLINLWGVVLQNEEEEA